jgi:excisionase family DNA binding protein
MDSNLLTLDELAMSLKVPKQTIYYWVCRKQVPYLKVGRHLRFRHDDVLRHFTEKTAESQPACANFPLPIQHRRVGSLKIRGAALTSEKE